jgi:hypothetical protein
LEDYLGGFVMPIDCQLWDNPSPAIAEYKIFNEDLGLRGVTVPADPEFYEQLVQTARRGDGSHNCNWAIANLINYPGPSTDKLLQDLIGSKSASRGLAEDVAWFFRYRYDLSDPLHRELVGHWQLLGHRERIDITLNEDATFIATAYEVEQFILRNVDQDLFEEVHAKMRDPTFRDKLAERMWKAEGLFAEAKQRHNLSRAKYRGRAKVQIQAYLTAFVQNLKRLVAALLLMLYSRPYRVTSASTT